MDRLMGKMGTEPIPSMKRSIPLCNSCLCRLHVWSGDLCWGLTSVSWQLGWLQLIALLLWYSTSLPNYCYYYDYWSPDWPFDFCTVLCSTLNMCLWQVSLVSASGSLVGAHDLQLGSFFNVSDSWTVLYFGKVYIQIFSDCENGYFFNFHRLSMWMLLIS